MKPLKKVQICLVLNVFLLSVILASVVAFGQKSAYFRGGWADDFILVGVKIDTPSSYAMLLCLISVMNAIKVAVSELGEPVLIFNVYNPDKKVVTDFTQRQLLCYANLFFLISNTRRVFDVLITVTQIDIAVFSIVVEQCLSMCTVCFLVKEKRFDVEGALTSNTNGCDSF